MSSQSQASAGNGGLVHNRWLQLIAGVLAMMVISNYQYGFTLFTPGIKATFADVPYPKIAAIFSIFILFETWPVPVAGYLADKFGIRKLMTVGAILILLGWFLGGTIASSVFELYIYYGALAGTGAGIIYISCVANAVKWFPDRRGLAAGLTAAGFGGGAALTIIPIAHSISSLGWGRTMAVWGVGQGIVAIIAAMILRHPPQGWAPANWVPKKSGPVQSRTQYKWQQVLQRPAFWLLYLMFVFEVVGGLMATANLSQIARSLDVSKAVVFGVALVPFTATLTAIFNAAARIVWGAVSDRLGRENTMTIIFAFEGVLMFLVTLTAGHPLAFVAAYSFVFLFWGEIYALFSAATGDFFGAKNASANYGVLYTAKGVGSILAGYGAAFLAAYFSGSFAVPFYLSALQCLIAAFLAFFALKPLVRRQIAREAEAAPAATAPAAARA
ncbi:MAG TPA: oxalate/formate MFS antiporter [Myxococcales bacterium]|nr:oxalate/formate MFS antiporter [Myxococcales bacterium]